MATVRVNEISMMMMIMTKIIIIISCFRAQTPM